MDFPQFRKLSNDKAFYKIIDEMHFDEIQIVGTLRIMHHFRAEQYPEKLRIMDKLNCEGFEMSSEEEYNSMLPS